MIALLAALALGVDVTHEVAAGVGFSMHAGARSAAGGFGPSATYRLHLGDVVAPHLTVAPRLFLPLTLETALGVTVAAPVKAWRPAIGAEVAMFTGGALWIPEEPHPDAFRAGPLLDVRGIVRPLAFTKDDWTVSAWSLAIGRGLGHPASTWAVSIEFASIGWLFP